MGCGSGGFSQIDNAIRPGAHKVFCAKFQKEMEGLDEVPFEDIRSARRSMKTSPRKPGNCGSST